MRNWRRLERVSCEIQLSFRLLVGRDASGGLAWLAKLALHKQSCLASPVQADLPHCAWVVSCCGGSPEITQSPLTNSNTVGVLKAVWAFKPRQTCTNLCGLLLSVSPLLAPALSI